MSADLHLIPSQDAAEDIYERLQEVFDEAKAGKLSSVAIVMVHKDGHSNWCWSHAPSVSLLLGAMERMKAALIRSTDED
jgi:hypothetical protein